METRCEEFRAQARECQTLADHSRELIKEQYEQLAHQWLFLAERTLIVRDPVLLCAAPHSCS